MEQLLTMQEVTGILKVSKKTLREWDAKKVLKPVRIGTGKHRRYRETDIEKFIEKSGE